MERSESFLIQCMLGLGLVVLCIGRLTAKNLHFQYPDNSLSVDPVKLLLHSNGTSQIFGNGSRITHGTKFEPWSVVKPRIPHRLKSNMDKNSFLKSNWGSTKPFEMNELKNTIQRLFTTPSSHPLHQETLKLSHMLHQVGFIGECSKTNPWRLQDTIFKVLNYVAHGRPLNGDKGDTLMLKEHPIRQIIQLFSDERGEKCFEKVNSTPLQQRFIEHLLQDLDTAIKDYLWRILRSSTLPLLSRQFSDVSELGFEFLRQICSQGLQSSEDRIEFCGETRPLNSTISTNLTLVGKDRPKRFAHPDDDVLDTIFRRAGYDHGHYGKPAEPEIIVIEEEDDKKKGHKALFIPKIILTVGTYILLCLLSLKAFFLSHAGQKGDKGVPGMDGEKGDKGLKGFPGHKGKRGYPGLKGDKGEPGVDGIAGEKGEKGIPGEMGFPGEKGHPGDKGDTGEKGSKGAKGQKGQQGAPGHRGPRGPRGRPAFHSSHRKKRDVHHKQTHHGSNFNHRHRYRRVKHKEYNIDELIELTQNKANRTPTNGFFKEASNRVIGPESVKPSKKSHLRQMKNKFPSAYAETKSMPKYNQKLTEANVFPIGPDGQYPKNTIRKALPSENRRVLETNIITSLERKKVSEFYQQLPSISTNNKSFNSYGETEFVISAMNELWQLYQSPSGCLQCRLFDHLIAQPSADLDSYIIAGFAHVLGDTEALQMLERVKRSKEQKKTLSCIKSGMTKCKLVGL